MWREDRKEAGKSEDLPELNLKNLSEEKGLRFRFARKLRDLPVSDPLFPPLWMTTPDAV
jgi:hypothetical protein